LNQETFADYEEDITENFTFSRRKSMKRVSFAGRDEVKCVKYFKEIIHQLL